MKRRDQAYVGMAGIVAVFVVIFFAGAPLFALVWLVIAGVGFVAYFRSTHPDHEQRTLPFVGNIGDVISGRGSVPSGTRPPPPPPPPTGQPPGPPAGPTSGKPAGEEPAEGPPFSEAEWHAQQEALRERAAAEAERRTAEREAKRAKSEARKEERKAQREVKAKARDEARAAEASAREATAKAEQAALLERVAADPTVVVGPGGSLDAEVAATDDRTAEDARRELERLEREDAARRSRERQVEAERTRSDESIAADAKPDVDTAVPEVDATVDTDTDADGSGPATAPAVVDEKAELLALEADLKAALAAERAQKAATEKAAAQKPSPEERARLAREVEDHRQEALAAEADLKAEEEQRAAQEAAAAREVERREIEAKFAAETPSDDAEILAAATESRLEPSTGEMTGGPAAVESHGDEAADQKVYLLNKVRLKLSDYE